MAFSWLTVLIWVSILAFIGGLILIAIFIVEHEDKNKKTTGNKLFIAAGLVLTVLGLIGIIFYLVKRSSNKKKAIEMEIEMAAVPKQNMMSRPGYSPIGQQQNYGMGGGMGYGMNQGYGGFQGAPTMQPMTPRFDPNGMSYPGYMGQPMMFNGMGMNQGMGYSQFGV